MRIGRIAFSLLVPIAVGCLVFLLIGTGDDADNKEQSKPLTENRGDSNYKFSFSDSEGAEISYITWGPRSDFDEAPPEWIKWHGSGRSVKFVRESEQEAARPKISTASFLAIYVRPIHCHQCDAALESREIKDDEENDRQEADSGGH